MANILRLFVPDHSYDQAAHGNHPLFSLIAAALPDWSLRYYRDHALARLIAPYRGGLSLFYKHQPLHPRCLSLRRAYLRPFWRIENTNHRGDFGIAQTHFPQDLPAHPNAQAFCSYWRGQLLPNAKITSQGYIYVPLQGHIRKRRSFQSLSPIDMIEATLARDPRPIRANLHPKEHYDPADLRALDKLSERFPRFQLVQKPSQSLLAQCDYLVTQNSAAALTGFFAGKRAIVFADIDFHHIAGSVPRDGIDAAFATLDAPPPDFSAYLHWFFHTDCIDTTAADAPLHILHRLRAHGWPV